MLTRDANGTQYSIPFESYVTLIPVPASLPLLASSLLITVNSKSELASDDIIRNFQPRYEQLDRKVITTDRGKEFRVTSLRKGGSPVTSQSIKGGIRMEKQSLNLIDATAVFLAGKDKDIIEVTAGVTDLPFSAEMNPEEKQESLVNLAEERLEEYLAGIVVK